MRKIIVVTDNLIADTEQWEIHLASVLQGYVESTNLQNIHIEQITDISILKNYFDTGQISANDTFIFTNAWSPNATYVKHWAEICKVEIKLIGFWTHEANINGQKPLHTQTWRKFSELASFRCLDKSYFISNYYKELVQPLVSKYIYAERVKVISYPLDYLSLEMSAYKDSYYKQNIIVFPWSKYTELHEQIVYDFIRAYKDIHVLFAQERKPLERPLLLDQISKAKLAFLPYKSANIGEEIYECLLLGTIPLVPDLKGFENLVPAEFRYPPEWTENIYSYCTHAPDLISKIRNLVVNYDTYKQVIKDHLDYLYEHYYDSEQIIKELFGN